MKKILTMLRQNINAQITALASATGKEVEDMRAGLQAQLTSLAELDKLPEAEVNGAFAEAVKLQQEHAVRLFTDLTAARTELAKVTANLAELNGKVTSGELLDKAKVTERCELAKTAGVESCTAEIADLRKKVIAKLPVPPENILKLPTAEFASALTDAEKNLEAAKALGLTLENKGAKFLQRALYSKPDVFAVELAELKDLGLTGKAGDPLLGGGNPDDRKDPGVRVPRLC